MRNDRRPAGPPRPQSRRDRRGRGLRGELAPRAVPRNRTPAEEFDELVLDAIEELESRWSTELASVEVAVEDVPAVPRGEAADFDPEVVADRGVPLGRLIRPGAGASVASAVPMIVIYRRPIEARAADTDDRGDLVFMVVAELVAELLGRDIEEIDPGH